MHSQNMVSASNDSNSVGAEEVIKLNNFVNIEIFCLPSKLGKFFDILHQEYTVITHFYNQERLEEKFRFFSDIEIEEEQVLTATDIPCEHMIHQH